MAKKYKLKDIRNTGFMEEREFNSKFEILKFLLEDFQNYRENEAKCEDLHLTFLLETYNLEIIEIDEMDNKVIVLDLEVLESMLCSEDGVKNMEQGISKNHILDWLENMKSVYPDGTIKILDKNNSKSFTYLDRTFKPVRSFTQEEKDMTFLEMNLKLRTCNDLNHKDWSHKQFYQAASQNDCYNYDIFETKLDGQIVQVIPRSKNLFIYM